MAARLLRVDPKLGDLLARVLEIDLEDARRRRRPNQPEVLVAVGVDV